MLLLFFFSLLIVLMSEILKSWVDLFSVSKNLELDFIEPDFIDGVLQIPQEAVDEGLERLNSYLVAQFLGDPLAVRDQQAIANRLWGHDGFVRVSTLEDGLFLFQFPFTETCD